MILFLLPSIAHLADFRDIAQPGFFRGFPGTITQPGIARPTLVTTHSSHTSPTFASLLDRIEYFSDWHRGSVSQIHRSAKCSVWLISRCRPIQM